MSVVNLRRYSLARGLVKGNEFADISFIAPSGSATFISASGGVITTSGSFKIHAFTSSANFTISSIGNDATYGSKVEILVVAGGGGGTGFFNGSHKGGGGAGGGVIYSASMDVTATTYTASIGAGGTGGVASVETPGGNGGNSIFTGSLISLVAIGGGGAGGIDLLTAPSGGSGGGGAINSGPSVSGSGTVGQGNNGGGASNSAPNYGGGGSGGAAGTGSQGSSTTGGNGGNGAPYTISGTSVYYSAGSGGGTFQGGTVGSPGTGGAAHDVTGSANTGAGGGGSTGAGGSTTGKNGGSGVIYVKYKYQETPAPSIVTDGLIYYVDAGNTSSYAGSGSTVYDLSGQGRTSTLYNGVTFDSGSSGSFNFDGTNDYLNTNSGFNPNITTKTLISWCRLKNVSQIGGLMGAGFPLSGETTDFDAIDYNETDDGWGFGSDNFNRTFWTDVKETSTNDWVMITAVYATGSNAYKMYRQDTLIGQGTKNVLALNNANTFYWLGSISGKTGGPLNAYISVGMIYNKALSEAEITQNYDFFKGRYGL